MLSLINELFREFDQSGVIYCHWKSNIDLVSACEGEGDLDLLFDREQSLDVLQILQANGFKRAESNIDRQYPGLEDYFGFDMESGKFVHLQAHFQLVTGQPLIKNYRFSIENEILSNLRAHEETRVPIPVPTLEAAMHIFRSLIKIGNGYAVRPGNCNRLLKSVEEELNYLLVNGASDIDEDLFKTVFPHINYSLFCELVSAMQSGISLTSWYSFRRQLMPSLRIFVRRSKINTFSAWLVRRIYLLWCVKLLRGAPKRMPGKGGVGVALLGSDGAGKSTNLKELESWLGSIYKVKAVHLGRPEPSIKTRIFGRLTGVVQRIGGKKYSDSPAGLPGEAVWPNSLAWIPANLYLSLAEDRWKAYCNAKRLIASGHIVLCDRFPLPSIKKMDSPRVELVANVNEPYYRKLARRESAIYRSFKKLDLTILLVLPPELAAERQAGDGRDYVLSRASEVMEFANSTPDGVQIVDANQPLKAVIATVRRHVWALI